MCLSCSSTRGNCQWVGKVKRIPGGGAAPSEGGGLSQGRGGLGRALVAPDQQSADKGTDGVEDEGQLQPLLPHQCREGVNRAFGGH